MYYRIFNFLLDLVLVLLTSDSVELLCLVPDFSEDFCLVFVQFGRDCFPRAGVQVLGGSEIPVTLLDCVLGRIMRHVNQVFCVRVERWAVLFEDFRVDVGLLHGLPAVESVEGTFLCPFPIAEELFKPVNVVDELIVGTSRKGSIRMSTVLDEVCRIDMI